MTDHDVAGAVWLERAGVERITCHPYLDDRGGFVELARLRTLRRFCQLNASYSQRGVVRGLHFHDRQADLFFCVAGLVRVVLLDLETDAVYREDVGVGNPTALYVPAGVAHGYEALEDSVVVYLATAEYDPDDPDEYEVCWRDPRIRSLWRETTPVLSDRDRAACEGVE